MARFLIWVCVVTSLLGFSLTCRPPIKTEDEKIFENVYGIENPRPGRFGSGRNHLPWSAPKR